jgi:hypothetical protein
VGTSPGGNTLAARATLDTTPTLPNTHSHAANNRRIMESTPATQDRCDPRTAILPAESAARY